MSTQISSNNPLIEPKIVFVQQLYLTCVKKKHYRNMILIKTAYNVSGYSEAAAGPYGLVRPPGVVLRRPSLQRPRGRHLGTRLANWSHHKRVDSKFYLFTIIYIFQLLNTPSVKLCINLIIFNYCIILILDLFASLEPSSKHHNLHLCLMYSLLLNIIPASRTNRRM